MNKIEIENLTSEELSETIRQAVRDELMTLQPKDEIPRFLSRSEVSKLLKISLPTLQIYTEKGIIRGSRVGTRVLYSEEDVKEAVKEIPERKYKRR